MSSKRNRQPRHHHDLGVLRREPNGVGKQLLELAGAGNVLCHRRDMREARSCFAQGGVRILFDVTGGREMVFSQLLEPDGMRSLQPAGDLRVPHRSDSDIIIIIIIIIMD